MKKTSVLQILSSAVLALAFVQPATATPMKNAYQGPSDYEKVVWDHEKEDTRKDEGKANKKEHKEKEDESNSAWKKEYDAMKGKHKKKKAHKKDKKDMAAYKKHKKGDNKKKWRKWVKKGDHKKPKPYVPVPAPSVLMLLSAGLIGVVAVNRRRRSKS